MDEAKFDISRLLMVQSNDGVLFSIYNSLLMFNSNHMFILHGLGNLKFSPIFYHRVQISTKHCHHNSIEWCISNRLVLFVGQHEERILQNTICHYIFCKYIFNEHESLQTKDIFVKV